MLSSKSIGLAICIRADGPVEGRAFRHLKKYRGTMKTNGYHGLDAYGDPYPTVRHVLAPSTPSSARRSWTHSSRGFSVRLVTAEDVEEIFGSIEKFACDVGQTVSDVAKKAAPVVKNATPRATQGALVGAALGPLGMLGVAQTALAGQEGQVGQQVAGSSPSMIGPDRQLKPVMLGVPAAGHLLNILSRPEMLHGCSDDNWQSNWAAKCAGGW